MTSDERHAAVLSRYTDFVNPYLGRLMAFAGFGVEDHAEGCYIYDHEGRKLLDCLGGYGVFSLGHSHPKVVQAAKDQLDKMPLSARAFFSERTAELAEKLASITPGNLQLTFFSNSGAESVEAALKFARAASGSTEFISTYGGFHGKTLGALSVTGRKKYQSPFEPLIPGAKFVEFGDAEAVASAVTEYTAAVIVEPIQGEGGIIVPPPGYLRDLREVCDKMGTLLIFDEVQTGMARTGKMFGCDHEGVAPDIMCLAKSLGGGVMPIGATICTQRVFDKVYSENPLLHTSTFGGNPTACAAAFATIEVIEEEGLCEKAETMGEILKSALKKATEGSELIADVRGRGLMLGVEFAADEVGELVISQMNKRGLIAAYTLNNPRVIRFEPPLTITEEEAVWAANTFGDAVRETEEILTAL
jgi:putrescine aminotransferase